jgi:hypothetical protein
MQDVRNERCVAVAFYFARVVLLLTFGGAKGDLGLSAERKATLGGARGDFSCIQSRCFQRP